MGVINFSLMGVISFCLMEAQTMGKIKEVIGYGVGATSVQYRFRE